MSICILKPVKPSRKLTTAGMALLLAGASSYAQSASKLYVKANGGVAFQQDIALKTQINPVPGDMKFDTGFRAGAVLGYQLNRSFAAELESGIIQNNVNYIGVQTLSSYGANATLDEIPLLVNGVYTPACKWHLKPYIGVGLGTVIGIFDSSRVTGLYFTGPGGTTTYHSTDVTFAYQAEVGLNYMLGRHVTLGLAYKFMGTTDHSWQDNNTPLKTDGTMTHAIEATLTFRF